MEHTPHHTPEPWAYSIGDQKLNSDSTIFHATDSEFIIGRVICEAKNEYQRADDICNVKRIVACVNACERANTAPMVNKATGDAESANKPTVLAKGPANSYDMADAKTPKLIAQGMGLASTALSAFLAARAAPCSSAPSKRDKATHSEVVITKSTTMVTIAGPAAPAPNKATSNGTPMKPVFGNAATKAPNAASSQPMRAFKLTATVKPTISKAHSK